MSNITKRDIRRLGEGDMPLTLADKPFIVMHQSVKMRMTGEQSFQWNIDFSPSEEDSFEIDRDTARRIIEANGMELAHTERSGQIYELPGRPFHRKYERRAPSLAS